MNRAAAALVLATVFSLSAARARPAWAQDAATATPLDPSESSCLGQNIGSPCDSATTTAGGSCLVGCCCHFVTDPEGATVCAPCLACSDTSFKIPAFSPGACPDGGSLVSEDAGTVTPLMDAGGLTPVGTPPPSSSSPGGCSASANATSSPALVGLGVLLALGALGSRRPRAR